MKLICVSSGSESGNCYLLQGNDGHFVVLDCGVSYKAIDKASGFQSGLIDFALVTHHHADHASGIPQLLKNGIDVYSNMEVSKKYMGVGALGDRHKDYLFGWNVIPFSVPHTNTDGTPVQNFAYIIEHDGERLLYMTDWMYCPYKLYKFNINHFLIAVNYTNLEEENAGNIQHVLQGHSSLDTAIEFLKTSMTDDCRSLLACHLSNRNADEQEVMAALTNVAPTLKTFRIMKKGITVEL